MGRYTRVYALVSMRVPCVYARVVYVYRACVCACVCVCARVSGVDVCVCVRLHHSSSLIRFWIRL